VHHNCAAEQRRITGVDAFELIREQAHAALNAIRSGCREDHKRLISRVGAAYRVDELFYDGQPANSGSFVVTADYEQPSEGGLFAATADDGPPAQGLWFAAAADDEQAAENGSVLVATNDRQAAEDESVAVAAHQQDFASVAALDECSADQPNESAEVKAPPIVPVDLNERRLPIGIDENPGPPRYRRGSTLTAMARILISKDEKAPCALSARALVTDGHGVKTAWDGSAALGLKHLAETERREELVQRARKAAQRAVHEPDAEPQTKRNEPGDSRRNMWIALAITGAILLFLKLLSY
jgi:hypothetical protein